MIYIKMEGKCVMLEDTIKAHIILVWSPNEEIICRIGVCVGGDNIKIHF
jgi:hypothetical protein